MAHSARSAGGRRGRADSSAEMLGLALIFLFVAVVALVLVILL
jgi:hypothetical protein